MYDQEGELITALFRIKYLIDANNYSYTLNNFQAFKDLCYKTIYLPDIVSILSNMILHHLGMRVSCIPTVESFHPPVVLPVHVPMYCLPGIGDTITMGIEGRLNMT